MTDNEIIKALGYCKRSVGAILCTSECPMYSECDSEDPVVDICGLALDLINCQKAEIEELEKSLLKEKLRNNMLYEVGNEIKSVTIKEFAERLKEKSWIGMWETVAHVDVDEIDNLVKEMTE